MRRLTKYSLILAFLILVSIVSVVWYAAENFVVFEVLERSASPSGKFDWVLYTSDGGATTTTAMFVAVLPSGKKNYRADKYRVLALKHTYDVSPSWDDESSVVIRLPSTIEESEFLVRKSGAVGVAVRYLEQDERLEGMSFR